MPAPPAPPGTPAAGPERPEPLSPGFSDDEGSEEGADGHHHHHHRRRSGTGDVVDVAVEEAPGPERSRNGSIIPSKQTVFAADDDFKEAPSSDAQSAIHGLLLKGLKMGSVPIAQPRGSRTISPGGARSAARSEPPPRSPSDVLSSDVGSGGETRTPSPRMIKRGGSLDQTIMAVSQATVLGNLGAQTNSELREGQAAIESKFILFAERCREAYCEILEENEQVLPSDLMPALKGMNRRVSWAIFDDAMEAKDIPMDKALTQEEFVEIACELEHTRLQENLRRCQEHAAELDELRTTDLVKIVGDGMSWIPGYELLLPDAALTQGFDFAIMLLLVVVFISLPLTLAFEEVNKRMALANFLFDCVFMLDVLKNFNVGYTSDDGVLIFDRHLISQNYRRGWFAIDVASSIPVDQILGLVLRRSSESQGDLYQAKKALKVLRLVRMTKLLKLLPATPLVQRIRAQWVTVLDYYKIQFSDAAIRMLQLFLFLFILAHWLGCMLYMIARLWGYPSDSWVVAAGLMAKNGDAKMSVTNRYLWCLFKAFVLLVGEAYEYPITSQTCESLRSFCRIESWFTLICLYIGTLFYAALGAGKACEIPDVKGSYSRSVSTRFG